MPHIPLASHRRTLLAIVTMGVAGCAIAGTSYDLQPKSPDAASVAAVDRFQDGFATLFRRSAPAFGPAATAAAIPAPNAPIDLDKFLVHSFGPAGELVTYYSLDIINPVPQTIYCVVGADGSPIAGQLPVFTAMPGDPNYSDFGRITKIEVAAGYKANMIAGASDVACVLAKGARSTLTETIVNWPLVPEGTTARLRFRGKDATGNRGWIDQQMVPFLAFETNLSATPGGTVPTVPIIVIFANDTSPAGGFAADPNGQTHNVVALLPGQPGYSSFWDHSVGRLAGFASVHDLASAEANVKAKVSVIVNCPVVSP